MSKRTRDRGREVLNRSPIDWIERWQRGELKLPTPWIDIPDFDGYGTKVSYRAVDLTGLEVRVTPVAYADNIKVEIGFANARARAVLDEDTCEYCQSRHDGVVQVLPPFAECTAENGCRCVAVQPCCSSSHDPPDTACRSFLAGANGRCVYCDHEEKCHPGPGATCDIGSGEGPA